MLARSAVLSAMADESVKFGNNYEIFKVIMRDTINGLHNIIENIVRCFEELFTFVFARKFKWV